MCMYINKCESKICTHSAVIHIIYNMAWVIDEFGSPDMATHSKTTLERLLFEKANEECCSQMDYADC